MKREVGYYWVYLNDSWRVAFWDKDYFGVGYGWKLMDFPEFFEDDVFDKIDERRIERTE